MVGGVVDKQADGALTQFRRVAESRSSRHGLHLNERPTHWSWFNQVVTVVGIHVPDEDIGGVITAEIRLRRRP